MFDAQAPLLGWLRVAQAIFTAVLLTALLGLLFTVIRQLEPVGTISGRLGPIEESRRSTYEAAYAVTILTDENELLLVNLRNHGRIIAYLHEYQPNEPVTLVYQDRTAVSLTTAAGQITEYSTLNKAMIFLLIALCLLLLIALLFPSFIESRFPRSVA